ncbi:hypothetical protein HRR83_007071 [Exophiala dermatitidis]|nr:hypothetical protein HRR77_005572 [Exophiala dermatitidis]KAJ4580045.1 hypothetical protein HRR81_002208 [Exophiala dermatitidis]KAJ4592513.1 hypothetical protein HRR83_007071 [Exophiala dermatitidis]KAJ4611435.1 hypothetical protein HRR85_005255 [Exophiala dermatitidis]KAJ4666530.1 hypothetical protein HRR92_007599 [Exophiala dermatitidis]
MSGWDNPPPGGENIPPAPATDSIHSFNTAALAEAIADIVPAARNQADEAVKRERAEASRQAGWCEPMAFNYDATAPTAALNVNPDGDNGNDASVPAGWAHNAQKYEWQEDYGDVGPRHEELEKELFRAEHINRAGDKFKNLKSVTVIIESKTRVDPIKSFEDAGLHPVVQDNIKLCGYVDPTPIQAYTIPAVLQGHDMIGVAQTGSGKTAAFLVPCISKLMGKVKKLAAPRPNIGAGFDPARDGVRAEPLILIVAPTRELCCQIFDEARRLCYRSMLRPCVAYGGAPARDQISQLARGCDLLVATPGRLLDFMNRPNILSLSRVKYTIIDEADEMLHDDWEQEMTKIMSGGDANLDGDHRYLLFSATFPKRLQKLASKFLETDYVHVSIGRTGSVHINVKQNILWIDQDKKKEALYHLLLSMPPSRTLIFVRSKKTADFVDDYLFNLALPSTSIHSDRTQYEREDALRAFKSGKAPILVATGVSARGLDVRNVMHVINFDLPDVDHDGRNEYVHRIGRTARIGNEGLATSFYNEKDEGLGPFLTKILIECGQPVPEFLQHHKPEDGVLNFEEEEEPELDDAAAGNEAGGDAWGAGGEANADDAWGSAEVVVPTAEANDAWVPDNDAPVAKGGW